MVISAVSFSEVSEIAIVPDSECRIPTLIVSPSAAAVAVAFVSVVVSPELAVSFEFEQPTSKLLPIIAAVNKVSEVDSFLLGVVSAETDKLVIKFSKNKSKIAKAVSRLLPKNKASLYD
jgi:hypothetical protein